jgi:anti-anti-sigma factor
VTVTAGPDRLLVSLTGEIDVDNAPRLADLLTGLTTAGRDVHIDLGGIDFCDCAGARALARGRQHILAQGRSTRLLRVTPIMALVLELTVTRDLFEPRP